MTLAANATERLDRRVVKTRKAIMEAFDKLISKGDIAKITISAIAREANIDRKTFYLHYNSVDDLANHKMEEALERILGALKAKGIGKPNMERVHIVLEEVNAILKEDITLYANIASCLSTDQMLERFEQAAQPAFMHAGMESEANANGQEHMQLQFYFAGAWSLYSTWLKSNRRQPIEEVSRAIEKAIATSHVDDSPLLKAIS